MSPISDQSSIKPQTDKRKRVLIFIVSYNAEKFIIDVLKRIPFEAINNSVLHSDILVIDDCSPDSTFEVASAHRIKTLEPHLTVLKNPHNLGYGGNQKIGYEYAISKGYDYVVLLHGDGQYAPEEIPRLLQPLINNECDVLFGSRMLYPNGALKGGMPLYKFIGNHILTWLENRLTGLNLSEWHSGYRVYSTKALKSIPFELNSNGFDFDTEIILQLNLAECRIHELAIPTKYGTEKCHVNGISYGINIIFSCIHARIQSYGMFYSKKYDIPYGSPRYYPKFHFISSHSKALDLMPPRENVLVFGCGSPELIDPFFKKNNNVISVDYSHQGTDFHSEIECHTFTSGHLNLHAILKGRMISRVLILDFIEHLDSPETFLYQLRNTQGLENAEFTFTTPNVAFIITRLLLLAGNFNYGKSGILDKSHQRLFTFKSLSTTLKEHGFDVIHKSGIPAPFPLALKSSPKIANFLLTINCILIRLSTTLFSYQMFFTSKARPTLKRLLEESVTHTSNLCVKK